MKVLIVSGENCQQRSDSLHYILRRRLWHSWIFTNKSEQKWSCGCCESEVMYMVFKEIRIIIMSCQKVVHHLLFGTCRKLPIEEIDFTLISLHPVGKHGMSRVLSQDLREVNFTYLISSISTIWIGRNMDCIRSLRWRCHYNSCSFFLFCFEWTNLSFTLNRYHEASSSKRLS